MSRAAFNVLVYPYRKMDHGRIEYALFKRSDLGFWQGISGGGEDDEIPLEAARRETSEESGLPADSEFIRLDTVEYIPVTEFGNGGLWGDDLYVIPQYCFGVHADGLRITISHEHSEYKWLPYEDAHGLLKYDGNKTALWELDGRLNGNGPLGKHK